MQAVGNDINTALGLSIVYDVLKADTNDATKLAIIDDFDRVLSLDLTKKEEDSTEAKQATDEELSYINKMIAERAEAKKAKNFARADEIRNELLEKGIAIKDTREGAVWERV
jgi:cysteinyl-tRNA synthetase